MITFKRFTSNERLSEETLAFAADVYWKGRKIGRASNDGRGGEAGFWSEKAASQQDLQAAYDYARQQQLDIGKPGEPELVNAERLEEYLDWLACDLAAIKRERSWLMRTIGKTILFYDAEGKLRAIKTKWNPVHKAKIVNAHPGCTILNECQINEAFRIHAEKMGLKLHLLG